MEESNIKHTAIYEAGHAVANVRIDDLKDQITIDPGEGLLGGLIAEGKNHVRNAKDAAKQVYSYCAGYAALMALGYSAEVPCLGAGDDFENASDLLEMWDLPGTLDEWLNRSAEFMSEPKNIRAVEFVANALMEYKTLDGDYVEMLVEWADGNMTDEEWRQFVSFQYPGMV